MDKTQVNFSGTAVAPSGTAVAPSGTAVAPSGTAVAPSGTAVAPSGTAVAPSGTAVVSQGTPNGNETVINYQQFDINGITYVVKKLISDKSGEARMYQVTTSGRDFALKLYNLHHHPNHDVLKAIKAMPKGNGLVIDLYDYGVWTSPEGDRHDYELMPYIEGGTLANVRPLRFDKDGAQRLHRIAIRMATEIAYCHEHKVLHRDIKPANFLYAGDDIEDFVLTDFGIGKLIGSDGTAIVDVGRTPIYAAPETYMQIPGRPQYATTAADFYSMGMSLMALWMGEGVLTSDEANQVKNKQRETLPYPQKKDVGDDMLALIKALTRFDDEKRATFADIERWARGEDVFRSDEPTAEFRIVFSSSEVAHSSEELSKIMWNNKDLAKRYLYREQVEKWFREIERPEIAMQMSIITEEEYPQNQDAGLYAACLLLDENMPYTGMHGDNIQSAEEIAEELTSNEEAYAQLLKDSNHLLWVYMRSTDGKELAAKYPNIIKKNGVRGVRQLTYYLDPRLPYRTEIDGKSYAIKSVDDLCDLLQNMDPDPARFVDEVANDDFLAWLEGKNPVRVRDMKKAMKTDLDDIQKMDGLRWVGLYTLAADRGYDFAPLASSSLATAEDLAHRMAKEINEGRMDSGTLAGAMDEKLFHFSRAYYYLIARGKYGAQIKWIDYCLDVSSTDNQRKPGPYTDLMARMKAVAGLLKDQCFPLEVGGKTVRTLAEYEKNKKAINQAVQGSFKARLLQDWLALQYQENPTANLSGGRYTKLTHDYLKCLMENLPDSQPAQQGLHTKKEIDKARKDYLSAKNKVNIIKWSVILFGYLPLIAVCGFIVYNLVFTVPSESFRSMMESIGNIMGWIVGIIGGLCLCAANPIVGIIGGVLLYYLTAWLVGLITPLIPWILVLILVGIMLVFSGFVFSKSSTVLVDKVSPGTDLEEAEHRAVLADAFDKRDQLLPGLPADYPARVYSSTAQLIRDGQNARRTMTVVMIIISAIVMGITYWATDGNLFGFGGSNSIKSEEVQNEVGITGLFAGTFDGRTATMNLEKIPQNGVIKGTVIINYSKPMTHQVEGSLDSDGRHLVLWVLNADGTRSKIIYYDGTMEFFDSGVQYNGTYYNKKKRSKRPFSFMQ